MRVIEVPISSKRPRVENSVTKLIRLCSCVACRSAYPELAMGLLRAVQ
jgi:hypothetical protein